MDVEIKETECYIYEKIIYYNNKIRYYRLEPSENFHDKNMDGALVKKRISKKEWESISDIKNIISL